MAKFCWNDYSNSILRLPDLIKIKIQMKQKLYVILRWIAIKIAIKMVTLIVMVV